MKHMTHVVKLACVASMILIMPGCGLMDWFKGSSGSACCDVDLGKATGEPVITIAGKTHLTSDQFDRKLAMIFQARQGINEFIARMSEEEQLKIYEQILGGCLAEQLVLDYVKAQKLDQTPEYKDVASQAHRQLDVDLALRAFNLALSQEVLSTIADDEAKKFYDSNQATMQIFQQEPFLIKAGDKDKKTKGEYAPFEAVKDFVKQVMSNEKMVAATEAKMEELKKDRQVTMNRDYLKKFIVTPVSATASSGKPAQAQAETKPAAPAKKAAKAA